MERCATAEGSAFEPGEWVARADGRVIAHGFDFYEVATDACTQADDIAFERIPFAAPRRAALAPPAPSLLPAARTALP
jgi:hypothetical protein